MMLTFDANCTCRVGAVGVQRMQGIAAVYAGGSVAVRWGAKLGAQQAGVQ